MAFYETNNNTNEAGVTYFKILDGSIIERSATERSGFELFETENPQTKQPVRYYIKRYQGVEGMVDYLERVELPDVNIYGYNLHMSDEDGQFSIFFKDNARTTNRLLKVYENLDLDLPVLVSVWKDQEGKAAITFKQDGKNVSQKWNPQNLPEVEKVQGKWDYSVHDKFLYKHFMSNGLAVLKEEDEAKADDKAEAATASAEAPVRGRKKKTEDEIPF